MNTIPRRSHLFGFLSASGPATFAEMRAVAPPMQAIAAVEAHGAFAGGRYAYADGDLLVAVAGAPRWTGVHGVAPDANVAARIAESYRARDARCLGELGGSFALAIVDALRGRAMLAVDRAGIETLSYAADARGLVFGTRADAVARAPGRAVGLRPQALFDFLLLHMVPSPDSVWEGVGKVPAGCVVTWEDGRCRCERHWVPRFHEGAARDERELGERLRTTLRESVAAVEPGERTGAFLSGGLDSSTVAGMLASLRGHGVPTFSIGFGAEGYDELPYARIASGHFGTRAHEYSVTPADVADAIPLIAAAYGEPFGNSSAVPTYVCARLAREHGIGHLLAGDGGDELFGGNERYARQQVFEAYGRVPAWIRSGLIEPAVRLVPPEFPVTPLRKLRSYVDQARIPMPERGESWNFVYRADLDAMLAPDFRASVDPRYPLRRMAELYAQSGARALVNRMLYFDWQYTLGDNDLRKVSTMCELAGVDVSYPMLDDRLFDLSLEITPRQKVHGSDLRAFYKRALSGFLPREIIRKSKHGFGLPFGVWMKEHRPLADLVYGLLGDLKRRRIVRVEFLDRLVAEHRSGHPGYYGYAIWDLALLEAWLARHAPSS